MQPAQEPADPRSSATLELQDAEGVLGRLRLGRGPDIQRVGRVVRAREGHPELER